MYNYVNCTFWYFDQFSKPSPNLDLHCTGTPDTALLFCCVYSVSPNKASLELGQGLGQGKIRVSFGPRD